MTARRVIGWANVVVTGAATLALSGPAAAQTGAIFWDRRGAAGGCCHGDNGHDGAPATDNFIDSQSGLDVRAGGTAVTVDVSGGDGGNSADLGTQNHWGGNGGIGRIVDYTIRDSRLLSTAGAGLVAISKGGDGGWWADGAAHGNGAQGHAVLLTLTGSTVFAQGFGISASSSGGTGQESAIAKFGAERDAGIGGNAGDIRVTLNGASTLSVQAARVSASRPSFWA